MSKELAILLLIMLRSMYHRPFCCLGALKIVLLSLEKVTLFLSKVTMKSSSTALLTEKSECLKAGSTWALLDVGESPGMFS